MPVCPAVLDGPGSRGGKETQRAIAYYARRPQPEEAFTFAVYSDDTVKRALNEAFHFKCAYCESHYAKLHPVDVEHYRPKGEVHTSSGRKLRPGYYWLAAEWDNLLPSCIDCNRARTQEDETGAASLRGKANLFPLADERRRIRRPGRSLTSEGALLLHPYRDLPEEHLEFVDDGVVRAALDPAAPGSRSARGEATIEVTGLNRHRLVHARASHMKRVKQQLQHVAEAAENVAERPGTTKYEDRLARELKDLAALQAESEEYCVLTTQLIAGARPGVSATSSLSEAGS